MSALRHDPNELLRARWGRWRRSACRCGGRQSGSSSTSSDGSPAERTGAASSPQQIFTSDSSSSA
eukprot:3378242-Pyramimonas_sp.AAC.1